MNPQLQLAIHARIGTGFVSHLRKNLRKVHAHLNSHLQTLSLALVNDKQMSRMHKQFMNLPGPTDVLTFPIDHDRRGRVIEGEIVICVPYARRAAKESAVPVKNELLLYAIHGMLHLSGMDDKTPAGFRRMHRVEDDILRSLGVGPVFHPAGEKC